LRAEHDDDGQDDEGDDGEDQDWPASIGRSVPWTKREMLPA
jgi:hypothetical protein